MESITCNQFINLIHIYTIKYICNNYDIYCDDYCLSNDSGCYCYCNDNNIYCYNRYYYYYRLFSVLFTAFLFSLCCMMTYMCYRTLNNKENKNIYDNLTIKQ